MKRIVFASGIFCLLAAICWAGNINLSGRASVYSAPGADSTSMMYGLSADYQVNPNLSIRAAVETTTYTVNNVQTTFVPISVDLIYHQTISNYLRPYAGAGVSYNTITTGNQTTQTSGGQAEIGIRFDLGGFSAGVEYRYLFPDLKDTSKYSTSSTAYASGYFSQSISF